MRPNPSGVVRLYQSSDRARKKLIRLINGLQTGLWLGILDGDALDRIDEIYYDSESVYYTPEYNLRGLSPWEREVVDRHFRDRRRLLLGGAGGGREVIALSRMGFDVVGFECNPKMVEFGDGLLKSEGLSARIEWATRDLCPPIHETFDGVIVGWGAYMHIQGRNRRIAFLESLRERSEPESPLLLSFFHRAAFERADRFSLILTNAIRALLRRSRCELGDSLDFNFVHYFTREQIASELSAAGFELIEYETHGFGHAVGRASAIKSDTVSEDLFLKKCGDSLSPLSDSS